MKILSLFLIALIISGTHASETPLLLCQSKNDLAIDKKFVETISKAKTVEMMSCNKGRSFGMTRPLEFFNQHLEGTGLALEKVIEEKYQRSPQVRVLELGAGHCRVLVQLRKLFPEIELEGINKSAERYNCEQTASFFKHFTNEQWGKQKKVPIHFMDLDPGKLDHFKDNSVDVVFSQYTIAYIVDKARLLEDIWRVLKPDGVALILFSELYIVGHYNSFGEVIDQLAKKNNIELKFIGNYWMLYMKKKKDIELKLPLKFDPTRSYRLPNYQYISFYEYLPS